LYWEVLVKDVDFLLAGGNTLHEHLSSYLSVLWA